MCPFCKHEDRTCPVHEQPNGRLVCDCGRHSWPSSAVFIESCRKADLTVTGQTHIWTQGM